MSWGQTVPPSRMFYVSYMNEIAVSEAREHLAEVIEGAQRTGEPVYLTRRGRAVAVVAVVVDPVVFGKLVEDAEDSLDHAELALARDEDEYFPWEQVKADLGLS
jgi:antitoxin Phd